MTLRRRNGKWHYRFKIDGREYSGTTDLADTARNENQARLLESEHRKALIEGRNPIRRLVVREFEEAAQDFLAWSKVEYRSHPNSHRRIATSLASARDFFARKPVGTINDRDIEFYKVWRFNEHQVRDITVRHDLHALSIFFKYAIKQHWAQANPIQNTKIPSDADSVRIHVITPHEEREYFLRAARNQNLYDLAQLMRNQGMRPEEVLSLRKQDIDLERGQLRIRSGKSKAAQRTLDMTTESMAIFARRWQNPSVWVFPSDKVAGAHLGRMNGAHDRVCCATKDQHALNFVLYDFRHTFATRMAQAGIDLATLAAILGHNSIRIVQRYVHPTAEHKQSAMRRFEESLVAIDEKAGSASGKRLQ
jgi:integrase